MKKMAMFVVAVFLLTTASVMADTMFNFSYNGSNINGAGFLIASSNGNGSFSVVSGQTSVVSGGTNLGNFLLIPNLNNPNQSTSPLGFFYYDNQLYSSQPYLDADGLLFANTSQELNIWGNGPNNLYSAYLAPPAYTVNNDVTFSVRPAPEPGTLALLGLGMLGLSFFRRRKND